MRVLLVEDDKMIGEGLQKALRQGNYSVNWVQDGVTAEGALNDESYDLVILDIGLPEKSGLDVLKTLRARQEMVPVLVLTARDAVSDRVKGLDLGADDYMLKPFALEELEARVRSLLRRQTGHAGEWLEYKNLRLSPKTHEAHYNGQKVALTGREFALMFALMKNPEGTLSKSQLEVSIYGWNEEVASNAIEVHVHQIRKKLSPTIIRNIRNVGYTLGDTA
ncbi:MAG TPA: response regulator transcription factor [Micavibrio sp.]|nr:response regulator transcription factor [Micavibrio sp.]